MNNQHTMIEVRKTDPSLRKLLPPEKPRPGITYVPSQYALPFEHKGNRYVFHTLTKQCLMTELPETAAAGCGYDKLIEGLFLVPENKDECAYYNSISNLLRVFRQKKGIKTYTILPTLHCNARCVYCYEEGREQISMSPETVEQLIRYIINTHRGDTVHLAWFGGEPLLGESVIDRVCEGLRQAGLSYSSAMISNGSLITPRIVEKMKDIWNLKSIQISVDGGENEYIRRKNYRAYHDYYHTVMKSVSNLSEAGIRVSIRCNVDEGNWDSVPAFINDMAAAVPRKEKVSIYFAPLNETRESENALAMWDKIIPATSLVSDAGFRTYTMHSNALSFRVHHCMADSGSVVVTPDGGLYSCEHCPPGSRFGNIWDGVTDEAAKKEFCRTDRTMEKCRTCPFLPICTSFSSCPITDFDCREMKKRTITDALKRMVDKRITEINETETDDEEGIIC